MKSTKKQVPEIALCSDCIWHGCFYSVVDSHVLPLGYISNIERHEIINEKKHAKRLYPLQISPKAQIEWGYVVNDDATTEETNDDDNDAEEDNTTNNSIRNWVTVDKTVLDSIPVKGIEKQMGFVGTPDPTTGFYCVYNEGRLVKSTDGSSAAATRPSSKKIG